MLKQLSLLDVSTDINRVITSLKSNDDILQLEAALLDRTKNNQIVFDVIAQKYSEQDFILVVNSVRKGFMPRLLSEKTQYKEGNNFITKSITCMMVLRYQSSKAIIAFLQSINTAELYSTIKSELADAKFTCQIQLGKNTKLGHQQQGYIKSLQEFVSIIDGLKASLKNASILISLQGKSRLSLELAMRYAEQQDDECRGWNALAYAAILRQNKDKAVVESADMFAERCIKYTTAATFHSIRHYTCMDQRFKECNQLHLVMLFTTRAATKILMDKVSAETLATWLPQRISCSHIYNQHQLKGYSAFEMFLLGFDLDCIEALLSKAPCAVIYNCCSSIDTNHTKLLNANQQITGLKSGLNKNTLSLKIDGVKAFYALLNYFQQLSKHKIDDRRKHAREFLQSIAQVPEDQWQKVTSSIFGEKRKFEKLGDFTEHEVCKILGIPKYEMMCSTIFNLNVIAITFGLHKCMAALKEILCIQDPQLNVDSNNAYESLTKRNKSFK